METFSALLAICAGNSPITVNPPLKGQWRAWIKGWVNNSEAGDLRRNRAHYDVTVMLLAYNLRIYLDTNQMWMHSSVNGNKFTGV